jgi:post-segregation antitoxin (ccd killing protein)
VKLSVYVPDELGREVKAASLPVSLICQAALRMALDRHAEFMAQIAEINARMLDEAARSKGGFMTEIAEMRTRAMSEEVGGHSPKRQTVDIKQVVSRLPKGPAPGATKKGTGL